jgi:hypothetical protein
MAAGTVWCTRIVGSELGRLGGLGVGDHGTVRAIVRRRIINRVLARDRMIADCSHLGWTVRPRMCVTPICSRIESSGRCRKRDLCILRIHGRLGPAWWNQSCVKWFQTRHRTT